MIIENIYNLKDIEIKLTGEDKVCIIKNCSNWINVNVICEEGRMENCSRFFKVYVGNTNDNMFKYYQK